MQANMIGARAAEFLSPSLPSGSAPSANPRERREPPADGILAAVSEALSFSGASFAIVTGGGRVQLAGGAGADGPFRVVDGCIAGTSEVDSRRLREAVRLSARHADRTRRIPLAAKTGAGSAEAAVIPLHKSQGDTDAEPLVLVVVRTSIHAASTARKDPLNLTAAERRLLLGLVTGERLIDYAARTGIKISTVKTHLRAVFEKTGERRQADLIRRAIMDPVLAELVRAKCAAEPVQMHQG